MGSSQSAGQQETTTKPWSGLQQNALKDVYKQIPGITNQELQYYPGSTVAPQGYGTQQALQGIQNQGLFGQGVGNAVNANNATISGQYLDPSSNPYLQGTIEAAQRPTIQAYQTAVAPGIDSQFAAAGRYGSGAHANAVGQANTQLAGALADSANKYAYANYGNERGLQMGAIGQAPGLDQASYGGLNAALGAGQMQDQFSQQNLNDLIARFNFGQDAKYNSLARGLTLAGQSTGQTSTQDLYENPWATWAGLGVGALGALSGAKGA